MRTLYIHRVVADLFLDKADRDQSFVQHLDGNSLNNRVSNLMYSSLSEIQQNRRKATGTASQYKGVRYVYSIDKYVARINVNGKDKQLGTFDFEEEANKAILKFKQKQQLPET